MPKQTKKLMKIQAIRSKRRNSFSLFSLKDIPLFFFPLTPPLRTRRLNADQLTHAEPCVHFLIGIISEFCSIKLIHLKKHNKLTTIVNNTGAKLFAVLIIKTKQEASSCQIKLFKKGREDSRKLKWPLKRIHSNINLNIK